MVKSWVCPKCLGDLDNFYVEEGATIVASEKVVCPSCGYTLEGFSDEGCAGEDTAPDGWHQRKGIPRPSDSRG